jgi:hypothetical protein
MEPGAATRPDDEGASVDLATEFRSRQQRLQNMLPLADFAVQRLDMRTLAHTIAYCHLNEQKCRAAGIVLGPQDTVEGLVHTLQRLVQLYDLCRTPVPLPALPRPTRAPPLRSPVPFPSLVAATLTQIRTICRDTYTHSPRRGQPQQLRARPPYRRVGRA